MTTLQLARDAMNLALETYPYEPPCFNWQAQVTARNAMHKAIAALEAVQVEPVAPIGWISSESMRRLGCGGNDSRGSVPIHAEKSSVSCYPVYATPQQPAAPELEGLYEEVTAERDRLLTVNAELLNVVTLYMVAGFGNSTNFHAQGIAWDAANEMLNKAPS